jgi:general secretion pathway protein C
MPVFLRKHFWAINLVTIALCALFAARALGRYVEGVISSSPPPRRASVPPPMLAQPTISGGPREITSILGRNIFCSTCDKVNETAVKATDPKDTQPATNDPVKTTLTLKLIATLVSEDDKAWSFAAILDTQDAKTRLYSLGAKLPGDAVLTDVLDRRVLLQNGNRNEYLDIEIGSVGPDGPAVASATPGVVSFQPTGMNSLEEEVGKSIRKVGEGKYEVERSALNKVLANTTLLARSARIVPSVKDGQPNGFKLYAIRPGSLYSMLGMFNGDTINAINGNSITTPDKALEIYTKLRNASHLTISFSRQSKSLTHDYTIR